MRGERLNRALPVLVVAACVAVLVFATPPVGVSAPLGVLLVVLPGLVWLPVLHPLPMGNLETFTAVVAISLGVAVLTGLVLTGFPQGLNGSSWSVALGLVSVAGLIAGRLRRTPRAMPAIAVRSPNPRQLAIVLLGVAILVAGGTMSYVSARHSNRESFTELSLVPRGSTHDPTTARQATVLVTNHEGVTTTYRLLLTTAGRSTSRTIVLRNGDSYRQLVPIQDDAASATLYKGATKRPYRVVWIGNASGRPAPQSTAGTPRPASG